MEKQTAKVASCSGLIHKIYLYYNRVTDRFIYNIPVFILNFFKKWLTRNLFLYSILINSNVCF